MNTTGDFRVAWKADPTWDQVLELDQIYFPRPWSSMQWNQLPDDPYLLMVCVKQQELLGFALWTHLQGDTASHLLKICFSPDFRGTGETVAFWDKSLKVLQLRGVKAANLEVEEGNARALAFYMKMGFLPLRKVKGYYSDGSNGIMMQLTL